MTPPGSPRRLPPDIDPTTIRAIVAAREAELVVTDDAIVILDDRTPRVLTWDNIRLVQLDVDRRVPVSLVIVPEWPVDPPELLTISDPTATEMLGTVFGRIARAMSDH